jgi:hypothetical protein
MDASVVVFTWAIRDGGGAKRRGLVMKLYLLTTATLFGIAIAVLELSSSAHATSLLR